MLARALLRFDLIMQPHKVRQCEAQRLELQDFLHALYHIFVGGKENSSMIKSAEDIHRVLPQSLLHVLPKWYHGEFSINHCEDYASKIREIVHD